MQGMKMSVCWMLMVLLGCRLSHASQPQSSCHCPCNEELRNTSELHREVLVPCPNVTANEMAFSLIKDETMISNIRCNRENKTFNCTPSQGVIVHQNTQDGLVSFILTDSSQGLYRCKGEVLFPPPYREVPSEVRIRIFVKGLRCECNKEAEKGSNSGVLWIWIMVVVVLIIYSLTVTITAFLIWIKLRRTDSQSDYMNTKPRAPRERKKRKGVQYPVARYI
ncbi:T-cell-specific surface glycoprotein CD28-like [Anabas testudineus]|uniref:CD28 molecule n=1 Tax=Anabas testudineus TaxID=64144 RepID=A0A3Q1ILW6_ANATE|nr:T-cell-specific surface glycoprotein CD28-like [Anabas testudineus]XP_026216967.1 T-cell-specific surface glycoprotein CD28-like [Anabas testudineus]